MFYSHEILSSPEHGVATIWLVATLGSRSVTKRLNKKDILNVNVPRACDVITNPEAPMALRLQGSLLYGVSRVYSHQCGYTLNDVQTMHDRMRAMFKVLPGGGLDPGAGKTKPDQLVIQDDPSFTPETNLPGLGIDFSKLTLVSEMSEVNPSRQGSFLLTQSPGASQILSENFNLQLEFSSDDILGHPAGGGLGSEPRYGGSARAKAPLGRISTSVVDNEAGVLLQPDFEFDEDGNIIELTGGQDRRSGYIQDHGDRGHQMREMPRSGAAAQMVDDVFLDEQSMNTDEGREIRPTPMTPQIPQSVPVQQASLPAEAAPKAHRDSPNTEETAEDRQTRNVSKSMMMDEQTAFRNTELAQINNEYLQNMALILKQKAQNRIPTLAKKNAAFWVFGQGIGSVGVGLGTSHLVHPLQAFSGDELLDSLHFEQKRRGAKKRGRASDEESDSESGKRARARESEDNIGRDVEIGRHASPALRDDHSSQMPWNITGSIQSSRYGSSTAKFFRSAGLSDSASTQLGGLSSRPRSRLTSASPLAGRGFPFDLDALNGHEGDYDVSGDFDLSHYLQSEADGGGNTIVQDDNGDINFRARDTGAAAFSNSPLRLTQKSILQSSLDQESINFLEFMYVQLDEQQPVPEADMQYDDEDVAMADTDFATPPPRQVPRAKNMVTFSSLLAPEDTSRAVATHAFMHILGLATKGFVGVRQGGYRDLSSDAYGTVYQFGEIHVRLPEI